MKSKSAHNSADFLKSTVAFTPASTRFIGCITCVSPKCSILAVGHLLCVNPLTYDRVDTGRHMNLASFFFSFLSIFFSYQEVETKFRKWSSTSCVCVGISRSFFLLIFLCFELNLRKLAATTSKLHSHWYSTQV